MKNSSTTRIATGLIALSAAVGFSVIAIAPINEAAAQGPRKESRSLAPQTNKEGAVSVTVTPLKLAAGSPAEFEIVLDTHSADLSDDLAKVVYLIHPAGQRQAPLEWQGSPPGGHHRKGVLRFAPLTAQPDSLELRIEGVGGIATRSFRWQLK